MRTWLLFVLLGVAGSLIVVGLLIVGFDVVRASRTGPRWKRRLIGAGLVLLGVAGFVALRSETTRWVNGLWTPSCYDMAPASYQEGDSSDDKDLRPATPEQWIVRTSNQLRLLREMAASGRIREEAARTALATVEADLSELRNMNDSSRLTSDEQVRLDGLVREAKEVSQEISPRLGDNP
jgi:hypothetical protein